MAWLRIEDSVGEHRKHLQAGPAASWLWVCGIAYCQRQLSDGFIPEQALPMLGVSKGVRPLVRRLLEAGLFDRAEGGYLVHDYLHYNDTKEEAVKRRADQHAAKVKAGLAGSRARWQSDSRLLQDANSKTMAPSQSHPIPIRKELKAAAKTPRRQPVEHPNDNVSIITKLAHEAIDIEGIKAELGLLADAVKSLCAIRGIAYNSDVVRKAVDSALAQRRRAS